MLSAQASAAGQAAPSWAGAPPPSTHPTSAASTQSTSHLSGTSPPNQGSSASAPDAVGGAAGPDALAPHQAPLFPRFSPEGGDPFAGAAAQQHAQHTALKQNLQKLYGSLGLQHGSRSSLPDIREDEPQTSLPSDPPLAPRLPPYGRPPATRALSDDDLFSMQDLGGGGGGGGAALPQGPPGAPPLLADLSQVGQLPAGATQSRTLFVRNVDPSVPEDELRTLFEAFGEVRSLYTAAKARGFVVVSYFDTRAATLAQHTLGGQVLAGQQLDVHFSLPKDDREAGQGTLLVASLDTGSSRQELLYLFSQYGELRDVADDPLGRANCCLVEFYDTRHAAAALQGITSNPDLASRLVVMDASGGGSAAAAPTPAPSLSASLSHDLLSALPHGVAHGSGASLHGHGGGGGGPAGQLRNVGSSPALLYGGGAHASSGQLDYLLGGGGGGGGGGLQMGQAASGQQGGPGSYHDPAAAQLLGSLSGGDPLAGLNRSFSEVSLEGGGDGGGGGGLGARFAPNSLSTGDLLAMAQGLGGGGGPPAAPGLRGIASTGSIWPHHAGQHASLGSSPVGAGWAGGLGGASSGSLQDLLTKQAAVTAALQQQAAAVNAAALLQQPSQLMQSAALQAAMQQALLTQQAAALLGGHGGLQGAGLLGGARRMDPPLGGRLARRPMDPVAEAERRMQQEKLYSLDLNKIRCGDDKRTTLMVKNIPNKYTQKMLLALVEERFRGMFDFFYLPIDFKNKCNVGYAFINMVRPEYIIPLVEELHGKKWPKFNSEKICHIAYGRIQGKAALVQHFQNSSLLHEDKRCRPILFHSNGALAGEVEQFPGTLPSPTLTPVPGALPPGTAPPANGGAASVPLMAAAAAVTASAAAPAMGQAAVSPAPEAGA